MILKYIFGLNLPKYPITKLFCSIIYLTYYFLYKIDNYNLINQHFIISFNYYFQ